jgi:hypothetical protein
VETTHSRPNPLREVRNCVMDNVRTTPEIARRTGLDPSVVKAALDHLARAGLVQAAPLTTGCPADACGSCALLKLGCSSGARKSRGLL